MENSQSTPTWPSLYNFLIEIEPIEHEDPVQPRGHYLHDANDVYRFTLYWTLIFYTPAFIICGTYAFLNLAFTPNSRLRRYLFLAPSKYSAVPTRSDIPLDPYRHSLSTPADGPSHSSGRGRIKHKERRSRLTFGLLVFFIFACCAVAGAVVGSAVLGYIMAGLFKAAKFNISTWIPFILALIQTLIGLLGVWPDVVDII